MSVNYPRELSHEIVEPLFNLVALNVTSTKTICVRGFNMLTLYCANPVWTSASAVIVSLEFF